MEIRVLGPVEAVTADGAVVPLGGAKQRAVLAMLALQPRKVVPVERLIDGLWGEQPPQRATSTLQVYVSNLRKALGHDSIATRSPGYTLDLDAEAVDLPRFQRLVREARGAPDPAARSRLLDEALALWRGPALADLADLPLSQTVAAGLEEERLAAWEARLDADLALGRHEQLIGELERLAEQHPLRERLHGQLMLALYRSGRQADALAAFDRTRTTLAEELGLDPSPDLRSLHERILRQDPALEAPQPPGRGVLGTDAPSGIVTFVFTDIEASTRLLHELGDRYVEVLERHREILRAAWAARGGHEISAEGDSLRVAFGSADDAVEACVAAQLSLAAEGWPQDARVRVRMGVHTGLASPRGGDYVALAAQETARVVAAAHGGQIVVSEASADAVAGPEGVDLHPLGRFRLRDFDKPVRLYQVVGDGLETDFPTVRAVPADHHNLVRQPTETIGREEEIALVAHAVDAGRLVTLVGSGGVGKTRLAADVGLRIAPAWKDGVWFVDLAGVTSPELVETAIADALGAPARPGRERWDDVLEDLGMGRAVLILDNCEQVVAACREAVASLLTACPGVAVLATSREPLHWAGETIWHVEPLAVPRGDPPRTEDVLASPAGRLFVERGAAVLSGFAVDEGNAAAVAAICRRLDGLPLLLELAAAHLRFQSPAEILAGLEGRFAVLQSRDPSVSERHRTVQGLLGWSHELLPDDERTAFRRLSIFGTSFTLETAAAAVATDGDGSDPSAVPQLVWSLVDRSLIVTDRAANDTRYRLLETVRSYGRALLDEHGETESVAVSLASRLVERLGPWLPADRRWTGEVGVELDNLRALIPILPEDREELAQQLACTIGRYHDAAQSFRDGIRELTGYVSTLRQPTPTRVSLLTILADLHLRTGEVEEATRLVEEAAALRDEHGPPDWDDVGVDRARGEIARRTGDLPAAAEIARAALDRSLSDRGRSRMYNLLGTTLGALGDLDAAYQACSEELRFGQAAGYEAYTVNAHGNLAEIALRLGDLPTASRHQRACLELAVALGSPAMVAVSLIVAARIAGANGEWTTATRLHGQADALLEETGLVLYADDRRQSEELLADARRELGDVTFARESSAGRDTALTEVVGLADSVLGSAAELKAGTIQ